MNRAQKLFGARNKSRHAPARMSSEPRFEREAQAAAANVGESPAPRDFARVRVHTDTEAHEHAEALGARAFTCGRDIYFGDGEFAPQSPAGRELIRHEMTHVAQQSAAGQTALQFDPKNEKAGIGAKPPAESFITMTESGSEDGFILFDHDDAVLDSGDEKEVLRLIGSPQAAVNLHLHGYASTEGPGEYNTNLSAHRAAAVQRFLKDKLPEGSKVTLFAHGETKEFGKSGSNRRVGVSLVSPLFPPGGAVFKPHLGMDLQLSLGKPPTILDPKLSRPNESPDLTTPYTLDPATLGAPAVAPPVLAPAKIPYNLMDLAAIHTPFALRGTNAAAQGADITGDWQRFYKQYDFLGEGLAARAANWTLSNAYDAYLARNQPNIFDTSKADFAAAYPGEHHTPIIPIITPDTLAFAKEYGGKYGAPAARAVGGAIDWWFQTVGDLISEKLFRVEKKKKKK
jgi:outer membrane protein OmpA-like peptidoglycan-associated protein